MSARARKSLGLLTVCVVAAVLLANPPRQPLKQCGCGTWNDPGARSTCRNCGASI